MKTLSFSTRSELKSFLDEKVEKFNNPGFIGPDPISIPHRFTKREDIEIAGFFAAILAWGQRPTILNKCLELMLRMENAPHQFVTQHQERDLKSLESFCHRTFNGTDLLYFIHFLKNVYQTDGSMEQAIFRGLEKEENPVELGLNRFRNRFVGDAFFPNRTGKHLSAPSKNSACKRLNMYLRWMVRRDEKGVDFGIWTTISPSRLICPCDVHVERTARILGLLKRPQVDWKMAMELTENLRDLDPEDPVRYDFALFGLGVEGYFR